MHTLQVCHLFQSAPLHKCKLGRLIWNSEFNSLCLCGAKQPENCAKEAGKGKFLEKESRSTKLMHLASTTYATCFLTMGERENVGVGTTCSA